MKTATKTKVIIYPDEDGKIVAENEVHLDAAIQMMNFFRAYYANNDAVAINSNLFVYYEEGNPKKRLAPDFFISYGVPKRVRMNYKVWEEGKYPDIVMEFSSTKTRKNDLGEKFAIYQDVWKVKEYFIFDPLGAWLKPRLQGFRHDGIVFQPIPANHERLASEVLGMSLEAENYRLRLFDTATEEPMVTPEQLLAEAERKIARLTAKLEEVTRHSTNGRHSD